MLSFVRRCGRSASLVTQRLLGIRLSHVQSVGKLLSQDQQNNLVKMDHLLMNLDDQQSHLQLCYHICSHHHWPLYLCQHQQFHFRDTMSHSQKRYQGNLGLSGHGMNQEGYILFNSLVAHLIQRVNSVNSGVQQGGAKEAKYYLMKLKFKFHIISLFHNAWHEQSPIDPFCFLWTGRGILAITFRSGCLAL